MGAGWAHLEAADPGLAALARAVIERHGLLLLATLRPDGAPRINPVEAHIVAGELSLVLIPHSHKARDLHRDPRLALQSPVADAADPGEELKIRGRAVEADDARNAIADAVEEASGWRPGESWRLVTVELDTVAHIQWLEGEMLLRRWSAAAGPGPPERRRLDVEAGAYVPERPGSLGP